MSLYLFIFITIAVLSIPVILEFLGAWYDENKSKKNRIEHSLETFREKFRKGEVDKIFLSMKESDAVKHLREHLLKYYNTIRYLQYSIYLGLFFIIFFGMGVLNFIRQSNLIEELYINWIGLIILIILVILFIKSIFKRIDIVTQNYIEKGIDRTFLVKP